MTGMYVDDGPPAPYPDEDWLASTRMLGLVLLLMLALFVGGVVALVVLL